MCGIRRPNSRRAKLSSKARNVCALWQEAPFQLLDRALIASREAARVRLVPRKISEVHRDLGDPVTVRRQVRPDGVMRLARVALPELYTWGTPCLRSAARISRWIRSRDMPGTSGPAAGRSSKVMAISIGAGTGATAGRLQARSNTESAVTLMAA